MHDIQGITSSSNAEKQNVEVLVSIDQNGIFKISATLEISESGGEGEPMEVDTNDDTSVSMIS